MAHGRLIIANSAKLWTMVYGLSTQIRKTKSPLKGYIHMDRFPIKVTRDSEEYLFEVIDYAHHTDDRCKFEVYRHGELVASFEPDPQGHLQVCKNTGQLDQELLHLVADEIETYDW